MDNQDWAKVADALKGPNLEGVAITADGHNVVLRVMRVKGLQYGIVPFVDGALPASSVNANDPIGQKFYRAETFCTIRPDDLRNLAKQFGQKFANQKAAKHSYTIHMLYWEDVESLRRHWETTCQQLQLVSINGQKVEVTHAAA